MKQQKFDIAFDSEKNCFIFCLYDNEGKLCRYCVLEDKVSLQVAKYHDITVDLKQAQNAVNELIKLDITENKLRNQTIIQALFDYTIILVIKCFNSSTGRKTSLDFKQIFKNTPEMQELYKKILDIRNDQIAHSGDYQNALVLYFDTIKNTPIDLRYSNIKRLSGKQIIEYDKLSQLINHTLKEVEKIKQKLYIKLSNDLKEKGALHYYSISKNIDKSTITTTVDIDGMLIGESYISK